MSPTGSDPPAAPRAALASAAPLVRLVNAFDRPFDNAVATARTCYSSRVIEPDEIGRDERARAQRDAIAQSTYAAGHHTVLQHATFQFVLENVSRQLVWSFLHAHPFYNSEQVSQRYVPVQPQRVLVPMLPAAEAALYRTTVDEQMACYLDLGEMLQGAAAREYFAVFPARRKQEAAYAGAVKKRAQEVARYALPLATHTHLYHTVSGLTLHRYHRLCDSFDVPAEARLVADAMIEAVHAVDPLFFARIEDPVPLAETHEYRLLEATRGIQVSESARGFREAFDAELGALSSRLLDYKPHAEGSMARSVRHVLGLAPAALSDDDAVAWVLSPARSRDLAGALDLTSHGKLSRAMAHPHYTFQKRLSHTADSQDQRHRMVPGSRPVLHCQYVGGEPDVVVPALLRRDAAALDRFMATMRRTWQAIDALLTAGVAPELALYLLPNAFPIRFEESGDLAALRHKWTTRLCYNAQEEIWRASVEEVQQVRAVNPRIGAHLGPPCAVRRDASARPLCPEGTRFCGVRVWTLELDDYARII